MARWMTLTPAGLMQRLMQDLMQGLDATTPEMGPDARADATVDATVDATPPSEVHATVDATDDGAVVTVDGQALRYAEARALKVASETARKNWLRRAPTPWDWANKRTPPDLVIYI